MCTGWRGSGRWVSLEASPQLVPLQSFLPVERQLDLPIRKEGQVPVTNLRGEPKVVQHSHQVVLVHIVEEPFDVKHQGCTMKACPLHDLYVMHEGQTHIQHAGESLRAKLHCGDQVVSVDVVQHALGNGLLQELGQALQEGDWVVVFSHCIIIPPQFEDDHHQDTTPAGRVMPNEEACVGKGGDMFGDTQPSLLQYASSLSRKAWGHCRGHGLQALPQFLHQEQVERMGGGYHPGAVQHPPGPW